MKPAGSSNKEEGRHYLMLFIYFRVSIKVQPALSLWQYNHFNHYTLCGDYSPFIISEHEVEKDKMPPKKMSIQPREEVSHTLLFSLSSRSQETKRSEIFKKVLTLYNNHHQ